MVWIIEEGEVKVKDYSDFEFLGYVWGSKVVIIVGEVDIG